VEYPKVAKPFPVFICEIESKIIIEHTPIEYLKVLFTTAFYTGMRLGELLNMKWNWIDFKQNIITVQCSAAFTTKSKKERIIPISANIRNPLSPQFPKVFDLEKTSFVFTRISGIKLHEDFVSKQFKKSVRAAELNEKIHFHTLRHSFASQLVQKGVSLYIVKELLGHEDLSTTLIYAHLQQQNLRDAINVL
jgi:site-specific recombinase XerD